MDSGSELTVPGNVVLLGAWDPCLHAGIAWISRILAARAPSLAIRVFPTALTLQDDHRFAGFYDSGSQYQNALIDFLEEDDSPQLCFVGWLNRPETARAIAGWLAQCDTTTVVMDPVRKATVQGDIHGAAWLSVCNILLPHVDWLLPNAEEWHWMQEAGCEPRDGLNLWITGGGDDLIEDRLLQGSQEIRCHRRQRAGFDPHGSGCTLAGLLIHALVTQKDDPFGHVSQELDRMWRVRDAEEFRLRALYEETVQ